MCPVSVRLVHLPLLAALLAAPGGCGTTDLFSYPPQARGSQVDPDELAQLVPGTSTEQDVKSLLGSPLAKEDFNENTWLYVSQITQPVIAGTQSVRNQHVYAISFDSKGVLTKVATRDKADALPVQVVSRTTPSPGSNASFLQQLIGNIGRFNPTGQPTATGPASTNTPGNY
jgi:outer membrane protein assembly factor BamE (lipoprotein component of BamABCDE complex)